MELNESEKKFILLTIDLLVDQLKAEAGEDEKRKKMLSDTQEICTTIKNKLQWKIKK